MGRTTSSTSKRVGSATEAEAVFIGPRYLSISCLRQPNSPNVGRTSWLSQLSKCRETACDDPGATYTDPNGLLHRRPHVLLLLQPCAARGGVYLIL